MAEARTQRRLSAILAADVVGYSKLTEANEDLTRARLRTLYYEIIDPRIAADGGRIVKTMGDGLLVEFPSAVDAVRNALSIQGAIRRRNADVPLVDTIELRVGINVGDVIIEGDDIHGEGVNVAARLEGLCEPGEVYISGTVYDQADGKLKARFEDLGEQSVKNIAKPVRVYRATNQAGANVGSELQPAGARVPSDKPSIAVLPFDNLSNDPEQEYFADGMAEDLITDISKISGVSVTARNSSFAFKGQAVDVKEIAQQLGVKNIVEGSVRKMGDRLRINAQLIDGTDGSHIWAERYDGNMAEIFDFQDDIREQIVSALQLSLTPTERALVNRKSTNSVEAYDLYLKGRANFYRFTPVHLPEAVKCFEDAIEIDPDFADAYGYLSYCHFSGWVQMYAGFEDSLERANEFAERGVSLDGTSAITLTRLGWVQAYVRRYDEGVANLEKAITLAPNDAEIYAAFGQVLNFLGNPEKGLESVEKALSLDTLAPPLWEFYAGISHFHLQQYGPALDRFESVIEQTPKFVPGYAYLAATYVELDRLEEAQATIKTLLGIAPQYTVEKSKNRNPYRIEKLSNRYFDNLRRAGLPEG